MSCWQGVNSRFLVFNLKLLNVCLPGNVGKDSQAILKLNVERPVFEEQDLRQIYQYEKPKISGM